MNLCPNCGTKDFSAEHRGTFSNKPCSNCGGNMKGNPLMDRDKAQASPKMPKMPKAAKMMVGKKKAKGKGKKSDAMYGC